MVTGNLGLAKLIVILLVFGYSCGDNELWCLQCSWSNTNTYTATNSTTNTTGDPLCSNVDLTDITVFPPNPISPIVNPMCTYESSAYSRLLEGPCYDYACYAQGRACVKWTTYMDGNLVNVTRLCAVTGSVTTGCYKQHIDVYDWEVCVCNDQQFCNDGQSFKYNRSGSVLLIYFGAAFILHYFYHLF